jgi:hypothetical protein
MKTSGLKCVLVLGAAAAVVWGCGSADPGMARQATPEATVLGDPSSQLTPRFAEAMPPADAPPPFVR